MKNKDTTNNRFPYSENVDAVVTSGGRVVLVKKGFPGPPEDSDFEADLIKEISKSIGSESTAKPGRRKRSAKTRTRGR